MSQDLFKIDYGFNRVPQGDEKIARDLYFKHAATLLRTYEQWKDVDRFYFIPVRLNMAFFCANWATAVAYQDLLRFVGVAEENL